MSAAFPERFLWGTASSSHQVEGGNENNDWYDWERAGKIHDGTRSGEACRWWSGMAERDLEMAAQGGQNAHRMSLEWSRLEPADGRWDDGAFARYEAILRAMRGLGLEPMVTLHHFTLPRWAAARGGFTWREISARFARYAAECGRRLGGLAGLWATMNEPSVLAFMGYLGDAWPPGTRDPRGGFVALARMLASHAAGYHAFKREAPQARVGVVLNAPIFDPSRPSSVLDRAAAAGQDWVFNGAVLRALDGGELLPPMALPRAKIDGLARSFDWLGLNYYGGYEVRFDPTRPAMAMGRHVQAPSTRTMHNDWGKTYPGGLTRQLVRLGALGVPLYVTENGVFDEPDEVRPAFLASHVEAVRQAIARGADVRGYFHWSLLDNFEWAEGWATRFGLVALDRASQRRSPRPSFEAYARICRANGALS